MTEAEKEWEPAQWQPQPIVDFREMEYGPRGYKVTVSKKGNVGSKRKLDEYAAQVEKERAEQEMRNEEDVPQVGKLKKPKHNTVGLAGESGRPWKRAATRAGALKNPNISTSWEKKMKVKAETDAYRSRKKEVIEARKEVAKEARRIKEEAIKRKEENRKKSQVTQKISSATAKRMMKSKKQRKLLTTT